ncbi:hypothetical protein [Microbulbifer sp. SAOS-129_SWC]|uniref:hypothetical protein n=1 Tax=Microbulbifer sp. SAOS-129_SWC TaxID=3145235 RepID=UPI003217D360
MNKAWMRSGCVAAGLLLGWACSLAPLADETPAAAQSAEVGEDDLGARYAAADLVAEVQIAGVHRDVDNALSEPGMTAILGYVYSAVSRQVWKGEANRLIAFRLGLDACEIKLKKGGRYLIFASPDSFGRLQLHSCKAAVPESEAGPLVARIKQIQQPG